MIKAVAHAVAHAEVLGLCLREQLVTRAAHFKFQSLNMPQIPVTSLPPSPCCHGILLSPETLPITITSQTGLQRSHMTSLQVENPVYRASVFLY